MPIKLNTKINRERRDKVSNNEDTADAVHLRRVGVNERIIITIRIKT